MSKKSVILILFMVLVLTTAVWAQDNDPIIPVPVFTDARVQAEVAYDSTTGLYTYAYTITNPGTNTGEIYDIDIDIRQPHRGQTLSSKGLTMRNCYKIRTFDEVLSKMRNPKPMVPVGIVTPSGWCGDIGNRGYADFCCGPHILPGETKGDFGLISRGLPTIRDIEIEPWWILYKHGSASGEDAQFVRDTKESLTVKTKTIGPTAPLLNRTATQKLDIIHSYIDESVQLGWAIDSSLVNNLIIKLNEARDAINSDDPSQAKVALTEFMNLIEQSSTSQLTSEARGLLFYNAQYLRNILTDTYIPPVELLELKPDKITLPIGTIHTLTATYTEVRGSIVTPMAGDRVELRIVAGPNEGMDIGSVYTDSNGQAVFTYTSTKVGTDELIAEKMDKIHLTKRI